MIPQTDPYADLERDMADELAGMADRILEWKPGDDGHQDEREPEIPYIEFAPAFLAVEDPPVQYLVEEILPAGVIALLHGEPRSRKSWAALELAIALATGTPAFGMEERFAVRTPVPVLYSSQEDRAREVRARAKAILKGRGIERFPDTLAFSVHKGICLDNFDWQERLIRDVERHGFRAVFLDPIRRYALSVDKGPSEVAAITGYLRRLTVETGVTIGAVHHDVKPAQSGKDDRRRSHRASGGDWFAAAECPISFERTGDSSLVIPEDYKFSVDPQPFSFRLETDDPKTPTWARLTAESASAEDAKTLALQQEILAFLAEHYGGGSGNAISKAVRARREDVAGCLEKLQQAGKVDCTGAGTSRKHTWFLVNTDE